MSLAHGTFWRCFPWDRTAADRAPYSVRSVAPARFQNYGRFDLRGAPLVMYLAQTPEHAVAEVMRGLVQDPARPSGDRHRLVAEDLVGGNKHRRALVEVQIATHVADRLPDMNDGVQLTRFGLRVDELSSNYYVTSQSAARRIYGHPDKVPGFVWWSRFGGDHHAAVLFLDRVEIDDLQFGPPAQLHLTDAAVITAARILNVDI